MTDAAQNTSAEHESENQDQGLGSKVVEKVRDIAGDVREEVGEFVEEAREFVGDAREEVGEFVGDAREKAGEIVENVKERVGLGNDDESQPDSATTMAATANEQPAFVEANAPVEAVAEPAVAQTDAPEEKVGGIFGLFNTVKDAVNSATSSVVDTAKNVLGVGNDDEATPAAAEAATTPVSTSSEAQAEPVVASTEGDAAETAVEAEPVVANTEGDVAETAVEAEPVVASTEGDAAEGEATEGASFEPKSDEGSTPRRLADLEPGMELEGKVTSTALYGIFVDVGVGRDGLVHISEMSDQRIESPTDLVQIGDVVKVRVKSIDADARRISLTMRTPRSESGEGRRRNRAPKRPEVNLDRLAEIKPNDLIEGTVNGIAPFGVFVDIGVGKDGLVHISELADGRVEKAEDAVAVGQTYTFRVLEVDAEGQRISLSLRRAQEGYQERPRPSSGASSGGGGGGGGGGRRREANLEAIAPGTILDGKVSGIAPFGAFIDLGVGRDGLVHISELAEGRIGKVEDVVNVGDAVKVRVIEVDPSSKRISLSMRLEMPVGPVSTSGSSRLDRDWTNPAERPRSGGGGGASTGGMGGGGERRGGGGGAGGGGGRRDRNDNRPAREPEMISFGGEEEEQTFEGGNATLDDLLTKFGSEDTRRPTKKRYEPEEEEDGETRARRDAIRRTLRDTFEE